MSEWIYCKDEMPPLNIKIFFVSGNKTHIGQREYFDEYDEDLFVSYGDYIDTSEEMGDVMSDLNVDVWMLYPKIMKISESNVKDDETCNEHRTTSIEKT